MSIKVGIVTISDRASKGEYEDQGGPALKQAAEGYKWEVGDEEIVGDDKREIQRAIKTLAARGCGLVLTTGGAGVAPRDVTPEAVREIADRELPGFGEVMRIESMKITPNAILSRSLAVAVGQTLVLSLPGKPSGAVERTRASPRARNEPIEGPYRNADKLLASPRRQSRAQHFAAALVQSRP